MQTVLKVFGFIVAALVLFPLVNAFPYTASFSGPSAVSLLENTSVSIPLEIQNNDFHSHTVKISGFSDDSAVKIIPNLKTFTISPYEKATVGIVVRALEDADHGTVPSKVRVDLDGQITEVPLTIYVGTNPYLTLTTFNTVVCAGEYVESISILVESRVSADTEVTLRAEQSILLPYTEEETLTLENGIEQYITFKVNVSPQNVGVYTGTILAETDKLIMIRPFVVRVNDCPVFVEKTISLKVPTKTYDLPKLKTTNVPITVKNLTDDAQFVEFFIETNIGYVLNSITIAPNDTAIVNAAFTPDLSIPAEKETLNITAVASGYSITQSFSVNVLPLDLLEMQSVNTIYEISEGETKNADFIITNKGDSPQNITFGTANAIPGVTFTFSPTTATLTAGKFAHVSVSIRVDDSTSTKNVNTSFVSTGKTSASIPIVFSILDSIDTTNIPIIFVSVPKEITLNTDEQKEISVTIQNNTDSSVLGLRFKLLGVNGANISVIGPLDTALAPHETKTIALKIVTQEDTPAGVYSPMLVVQGRNGSGAAPLSIRVNGGLINNLLTGLVTFANERAGILGFIILVILAVLYFLSRTEKRFPVWTAK